MPSVMDLALCANAVYNVDLRKVGPWNQAVPIYGNDSLGFFACAYIHENGRELIVAFRGTDDLSDALTDVTIFLGKFPNQAINAEIALKDILSKNKNIKSIYLTGHSLGGGLASLMADAHNLPAVTFNAPGMARSSIPDWIPSGIKEIAAWSKSVFDSEKDILHVRANFDVVSIGTGPRMGIIHNLTAICKVKTNISSPFSVNLPTYGVVKLLETAGKFILCQHEMMSIISAMKGSKLYFDPLNFSRF